MESQLMWRADSLEKTLMLGKIEGRRKGGRQRWDGWMVSLTQWTCLSKLQEIVKAREAWYCQWFIVHSLSCVQLFATPWTAALQASLFPRAYSNSCPLSQWYHPTFHPLCPRVGQDWATEQQHKGSPLSLRFSLSLQMPIAPKLALSLFKLIFHWGWKDLQITSNVGEVKMSWSVRAILGCFSPVHIVLY